MSLFGDRQHTAIGSDIEPLMKPAAKTAWRRGAFVTGTLPLSLMLLAGAAGPALAAGCAFEPQGEGRVVAIIDSRTFRLQDGREVILAGIEPVAAVKADAGRASALAALVAGREVTLSGEDDAPDRYGRQPAFAYLEGAESPVQGLLLEQGEAGQRGEQGLRFGAVCRGGRGARSKKRHLGRPGRHKKRGKSGRYFGRDRALCGGRGKGVVGPSGGRDDVPELRTELDTGLCCDYFKARNNGARG
jgi:hypothetical protein